MYCDDFERFYQMANNKNEYQQNDSLSIPTISRNRASSLRENSNRRHSQRVVQRATYDVEDKYVKEVGSYQNESQLHKNASNSHKDSIDQLNHSKFLSPINYCSTNSLETRRHSLLPSGNTNDIQVSTRRQLPSRSPRKTDIRRGSSPNPGIQYSSEPSPKDSLTRNNMVRVRSFKRTKGGLVNRGDKNVCMLENGYEEEKMQNNSSLVVSNKARDNRQSVKESIKQMNVQVLGGTDVGKTYLCKQFLHSESIIDHDNEYDYNGESNETLLSVQVEIDGQTTSLRISETTIHNNDIKGHIISSADAYIIVYAVDDRNSFALATEIIREIISSSKRSSAYLLVANKNDLVRTKVVSSEEGKNLAEIYNANFYEISVSLNHQIDNLLVGLVGAIEDGLIRVKREVDRLADRVASLTPNDPQFSPNPMSSSRRDSILDQISRSTSGKSISKFFRKHFKNIS